MHNEQHISIAQKTNQALLATLFKQAPKDAAFHVAAACALVYYFIDIGPLNELLFWFVGILGLAASKLLSKEIYQKYNDVNNYKLWLHVWAGTSALLGLGYALALIYFIPFEQAQFNLACGIVVIMLSSLVVLSNHASIYAVASFTTPLVLISGIALYTEGGELGLKVLAAIALFTAMLVFTIKELNNNIKKSISVQFQYQQESDKRHLLEKQLQDISRRDGLTGLFNRRYFEEMLELEIGRAHRNHSQLCLMIFDIDYFEEFNKHYGHVAGDKCLTDIADLSADIANRNGDLVARYSGEQFAIILPNIDIDGANAFASKLQQIVQNKRVKHEASALTSLKCVTVSIGVTNLMPFSKTTPAELIKQADEALFEAKRQGRNRVFINENNGLGHSASF